MDYFGVVTIGSYSTTHTTISLIPLFASWGLLDNLIPYICPRDMKEKHIIWWGSLGKKRHRIKMGLL